MPRSARKQQFWTEKLRKIQQKYNMLSQQFIFVRFCPTFGQWLRVTIPVTYLSRSDVAFTTANLRGIEILNFDLDLLKTGTWKVCHFFRVTSKLTSETILIIKLPEICSVHAHLCKLSIFRRPKKKKWRRIENRFRHVCSPRLPITGTGFIFPIDPKLTKLYTFCSRCTLEVSPNCSPDAIRVIYTTRPLVSVTWVIFRGLGLEVNPFDGT